MHEWIESVNDDLPEPESMADAWDHLPDLADPLIEGVLRKGHKMLVAGPSKAGKSFALIELCIAIAEGRKWLSWQCSKGRVMYVNLELDRPAVCTGLEMYMPHPGSVRSIWTIWTYGICAENRCRWTS